MRIPRSKRFHSFAPSKYLPKRIDGPRPNLPPASWFAHMRFAALGLAGEVLVPAGPEEWKVILFNGNLHFSRAGNEEEALSEFMRIIRGFNSCVLHCVPEGSGPLNFRVLFGDFFTIPAGRTTKSFMLRGDISIPTTASVHKQIYGVAGPTCGMCFSLHENWDGVIGYLTEHILDHLDEGTVLTAYEYARKFPPHPSLENINEAALAASTPPQ